MGQAHGLHHCQRFWHLHRDEQGQQRSGTVRQQRALITFHLARQRQGWGLRQAWEAAGGRMGMG